MLNLVSLFKLNHLNFLSQEFQTYNININFTHLFYLWKFHIIMNLNSFSMNYAESRSHIRRIITKHKEQAFVHCIDGHPLCVWIMNEHEQIYLIEVDKQILYTNSTGSDLFQKCFGKKLKRYFLHIFPLQSIKHYFDQIQYEYLQFKFKSATAISKIRWFQHYINPKWASTDKTHIKYNIFLGDIAFKRKYYMVALYHYEAIVQQITVCQENKKFLNKLYNSIFEIFFIQKRFKMICFAYQKLRKRDIHCKQITKIFRQAQKHYQHNDIRVTNSFLYINKIKGNQVIILFDDNSTKLHNVFQDLKNNVMKKIYINCKHLNELFLNLKMNVNKFRGYFNINVFMDDFFQFHCYDLHVIKSKKIRAKLQLFWNAFIAVSLMNFNPAMFRSNIFF